MKLEIARLRLELQTVKINKNFFKMTTFESFFIQTKNEKVEEIAMKNLAESRVKGFANELDALRDTLVDQQNLLGRSNEIQTSQNQQIIDLQRDLLQAERRAEAVKF